MLVKLTHAHNKQEFAIRCDFIIGVERRQDNPLQVIIITTLTGPKGPIQYELLESFDEVVAIINRAWGTRETFTVN